MRWLGTRITALLCVLLFDKTSGSTMLWTLLSTVRFISITCQTTGWLWSHIPSTSDWSPPQAEGDSAHNPYTINYRLSYWATSSGSDSVIVLQRRSYLSTEIVAWASHSSTNVRERAVVEILSLHHNIGVCLEALLRNWSSRGVHNFTISAKQVLLTKQGIQLWNEEHILSRWAKHHLESNIV